MEELHPWDKIKGEKAHKLLKSRVLELTLPPHNLTREQIANYVNRSISKIYHIQRELVTDGDLQTNPSGHIIKAKADRLASKYADLTQTQFMQIESIKRWRDSLQRSDVQKFKYMIVNFWKVCKTLDVHPDAFLIDDMNEVNPLVDKFIGLFKEGKTYYLKKNPVKDPLKQSKSTPQHYIEAIRSFIKRNGGDIAEGDLLIRRKPVDLYAKAKLSDNDRLRGIKYFNEIFGETFGDIFTLHNEMGVRSDTLFTMKPRFEKITRTFDGSDENDNLRLQVPCTWYKATIFEQKQKKSSRGGYFEKFIITPKAKKVVEKLNDDEPIHKFQSIKTCKDEYNEKLRQLYAHLGMISSNPIEQKGYEENTMRWFYVNYPTGVIRHSTIHWLMRITGNNASAVSTLFWEKSETLKIYAKQSFDDLLQINDCAFCRPPIESDARYRRFCNLKHALIFYNNGSKSKKEMINSA